MARDTNSKSWKEIRAEVDNTSITYEHFNTTHDNSS
jgi:hypothetical protein